ncbi:MAG: glycosyltransferase family 2 protein [Bacteroidales bacterium]
MENHTFVIPAYKDSPYLEECIINLKNQTSKSNIIITTSTPSEHIENIAKKYNIDYYINESKTGIANDWNFALSKAKTKLITIAHQDDIYESDFVESIFKKNNTAKRILIFFTDYIDLIENKDRDFSLNHIIKKMLLFPFLIKSTISSTFLKKFVLLFGDPICCPSVTLNMEELKSFSFSTGFDVNPDWYAWLELAKHEGAFIYINKKLMKHRIHAEMETLKQIKSNKRLEEELRMFEIMWGKYIGKLISRVYSQSHKDNII